MGHLLAAIRIAAINHLLIVRASATQRVGNLLLQRLRLHNFYRVPVAQNIFKQLHAGQQRIPALLILAVVVLIANRARGHLAGQHLIHPQAVHIDDL
jgi:hypothetical protein